MCLLKLFDPQVVVSGIVTLGVGGQKHDVKCIRIHPDYTGERESGWKHDIAVITVSSLRCVYTRCMERGEGETFGSPEEAMSVHVSHFHISRTTILQMFI